MKIQNKLRRTAAMLFLIYILILVWVIMLKCNMEIPVRMSLEFFGDMTVEQRAEWTFCHFRFNGDGPFISKDAIEDMLVNIVLFVPIGMMLPFIFKKHRFPMTALYGFLMTLAFELSQFIFAIGGFAYIDLITNTAGSVIGCALFYLIYPRLKENTVLKILHLAECTLLCILGFATVNTILNIELYFLK
jgi:glycopeptide antibiotics resistance protein